MDSSENGVRLGDLVRTARHARGLTLEELSTRAGVGLRTLGDLERNRVGRPHPRTIDALADAMDLPAAERERLRGVPTGSAVTVPAQLPLDGPAFGGRAGEVTALLTLPGRAAVGTIVGMPGVGKTTLAVHCAHRLAEQYPDGQLYLNLQGFAAGVPVVTAGQALRHFLDAFGVPAREIPVGADAQAALFRSLVSRRRVLILLDNARDAEQVRPLLPGSARCLTLITSRDALTELVTTPGAEALTLAPLDDRDSRDLLRRRVGAERLATDPAAVDRLVDACAGLPLALAIVAARAVMRPGFALSDLARDLGLRMLDRLGGGVGPVAIFSRSYDVLTPPAARLFRLLALYRGPGVGAAAAACLAGIDVPEADRLLDELTRAHLVIEIAPGRYAFHDLVRDYAAGLAAATETPSQRREALNRLLEGYFRERAYEAVEFVAYGRGPSRHFAAREQASDWLAAERDALVAVPAFAEAEGFTAIAVRVPLTIDTYLDMIGRREERADGLRVAARLARHTGEIDAQARCERRLGLAESDLGAVDAARGHLEESVRLAESAGDVPGQAEAYRFLSSVLSEADRLDEALPPGEKAVALYRDAGGNGFAGALNHLGYLHAKIGDPATGRRYCAEALAIIDPFPQSGRMRAAILDSLGYIDHRLADLAPAADHYREAARLRGVTGDLQRQATSLLGLADVATDLGDEDEAARARAQARAILERLRLPDSGPTRDLLTRAGAGRG